MPTQPPLSGGDFFEKSPAIVHRPGDIWTGLSSRGLLGKAPVRGVVITPACDLANDKAEMVTYLPVVPLTSYFSIAGALPVVLRRMEGLATAAGISYDFGDSVEYSCPSEMHVSKLRASARELLGGQVSAKVKEACVALGVGCDVIDSIRLPHLSNASALSFEALFGAKAWREMAGRLIRNAHSPDLHFLPADGQPVEWAALSHHSLVLFRYPITIPIQLLTLANLTPEDGWAQATEALSSNYPVALDYAANRPMKRATMKPRFYSDLLTRYLSLYLRLGAPSFTEAQVEQLLMQAGSTH